MSESSDKKTELDEYGVWIKNTAPADDNATVENTNNIPDELSDLSFLDKTAQSDFEQENGASAETAAEENSPVDEEISLDEFMDSDFTDPNEGLSPAPQTESSAAAAEPPAANESGEVSLDDFLDGGFESEPAEPAQADDNVENEETLDIDLSFDDTPDEEKFADIPQENNNTEEFANDDFNTLFGDDNSAAGSEGESVDLSEFGFGDDSEKKESTGSNENVDLSEFGFDDTDAGTQADKIEETKKEEGPVDYEMNVETDSDTQAPVIAETASDEEDEISVDTTMQAEETPVTADSDAPVSAPDDDFDLDSLLDGVDFGSDNETSSDAGENTVSENADVTQTVQDDDSEAAVFQDETDIVQDAAAENTVSEDVPLQEENIDFTAEAPDAETENPFTADDETDLQAAETQTDGTFDLDEPVFEEPQPSQEEDSDFNFEDMVVDVTPSGETADVSEEDVSDIDVSSLEAPQADDEVTETEEVKENSLELDDIDTSLLDGPAVKDDETENAFADITEDNQEQNENLAVTTSDDSETSEDGSYSFQEPDIADATDDVFSDTDFEAPAEESVQEEMTETEPAFEEPVFEEPAAGEENTEETEVSEAAVETEVDSDVSETEADDDLDTDIQAQAEESFPALNFAPISISTEDKSIPDTFEEEAASLESQDKEAEEQMSEVTAPVNDSEEKQAYSVFIKEEFVTEDTANEVQMQNTAPVQQKEPAPAPQPSDSGFDAGSLLKDIAAQIASLKTEISSLKTEFEELKNNEGAAKTVSAAAENNDIDLPVPGSEKDDDSGFFSDNDEDDTIALSGEELNNILNTAELTPPEEAVAPSEAEESLSMNFENEKLEEPVFEETEPEEEPQEEISVPKVDDIIVEPSASDLIEEKEESAAPDEEENFSDLITVDQPGLGEIENTEEEEEDDLSPSIESLSKPIELFKEEEEDEELEKGISEEPVGQVFDQWNSKDDEPASDADSVDEDAEQAVETEEAPVQQSEENASSADSIPEGMKEEIKSVLSYMDQLLESLPEEKITEFAQSEQFETYKKLFKELGLA
jgi:hypothetical protein